MSRVSTLVVLALASGGCRPDSPAAPPSPEASVTCAERCPAGPDADAVIAEITRPSAGRDQLAVIQGSCKLIVQSAPSPGVELYDRRRDPGERHDLAAACPDVVERLRGVLRRRVAGQHVPHPPTSPLSPEDRELLERLGYVR